MLNYLLNLLQFNVLFLSLFLINLKFAYALPYHSSKNTINAAIHPVSQLSDIQINSWEYQALKDLNNRYQCLKEDDLLTQSDLTITRYQFTQLLYLCLTEIQTQNPLLSSQEIATLKRLQQDFKPPLTQVTTKLQTLENKVATIEQQSSNPNIELEGEAIIAVGGVGQNNGQNTLNLGMRVRLDFITRFTEKDQLQIRLQGRSIPEFEEITDTKMANLGFDGDDDGELQIDEIEYELSFTKNTTLGLYALGGGTGDLVPTVNPLFSGSGDGSISTFGRENPIRRQAEGTAISLSQDFSKDWNFTLGYVSNNANEIDQGLINGSYGMITQLALLSDDSFSFSLTYSYTNNNIATGTGSALAENPFKNSDQILGHSYGGEVSLWLSPNVNLGGRVGWIQARSQDLPNHPKADIFTWATMLGITDLGTEDSLLGFIFGQPPKVLHNSLGNNFEDPDTAHHVELFYRWQVMNNISITPGFFWVFNPEHNKDRDSFFVGTIRTTLEF